ncbi:MAG TPA: carboxypeptidase regulatory-like domain-containing protein [Tepidisphaeraceae bacterium]
MDRSIWLAAALSFGIYSASFAQIGGKVTLQGTPPEMNQIKAMAAMPQCAQLHKDPVYEDTVITGDKGELANVIVFIKEGKPGDLKGPQIDKPASLDQKGCMYQPHVLAVQIGQPVVVVSSDPFLHNVHCMAVANKPFNIVQINVGEKKLEPFTTEETFQIKCDVHPWMKAVVRVFDHSYFATTGENGKFSIDTKDLKDGAYVVQAWHELYKDSEPQTIEVKGGKATRELDFTYKAGAKTQAAPMKEIHLASIAGTPASAAK